MKDFTALLIKPTLVAITVAAWQWPHLEWLDNLSVVLNVVGVLLTYAFLIVAILIRVGSASMDDGKGWADTCMGINGNKPKFSMADRVFTIVTNMAWIATLVINSWTVSALVAFVVMVTFINIKATGARLTAAKTSAAASNAATGELIEVEYVAPSRRA